MKRNEAIESGMLTYNTGKPCVNGHVAERYTKNGGCVECIKETAKKFNRQTATKIIEQRDKLDIDTTLISMYARQEDFITIRDLVRDLITEYCPHLNPDNVNNSRIKGVCVHATDGIYRISLRVPNDVVSKVKCFADSLRLLSSKPVQEPDYSAGAPVIHENPDLDINNP